MLLKKRELVEIYDLKHRHDNDDTYIEYDKNILDNSLSPYIYNNDMMNGFLKGLQPLVALLLDNMNIIKNFKNYIVNKYDFRHIG
jgi:hypothetical protein